MKRTKEIAKEIFKSFESNPELLPGNFLEVTWDTPGVGSITFDELEAKIICALQEYGEEVRKKAAQKCRLEHLEGSCATPDDIAYDIAIDDCVKTIEKMELP